MRSRTTPTAGETSGETVERRSGGFAAQRAQDAQAVVVGRDQLGYLLSLVREGMAEVLGGGDVALLSLPPREHLLQPHFHKR